MVPRQVGQHHLARQPRAPSKAKRGFSYPNSYCSLPILTQTNNRQYNTKDSANGYYGLWIHEHHLLIGDAAQVAKHRKPLYKKMAQHIVTI